MHKKFFYSENLRLSYTDTATDLPVLISLHGHFGRGSTFHPLQQALQDQWRVICLDQRGHGYSDHAESYTRADYLNDLHQFILHLGLDQVVLLGHSLGGVNAYQYAARHPERVQALVIVDVGAEIDVPTDHALDWPRRFPTLEALRAFLREQKTSEKYFGESVMEDESGWGFRFKADHLSRSQQHVLGNWWSDWLATSCPTLLIQGHKSWVLSTDQAREMARKRPFTTLVEFPECGHGVYQEDPEGFNGVVREFLQGLL
ncbi:alpha/beta fold hydrolase [Deinococcus cellulosilyticus]|uniref:AB hydrolase-1 domain-containing protein n=1 Tax=Deinococcus cellulosilyticus (strain DSM 18568 / NBRC 106333 / KACC 11606 / 5516J-15) TaxID=1223518 RepID=A0A511MVI7_DEIC1|nr:alpha/beta hydrolase [Deinococcus cellulosilyticus]GEM44599.1 hypothetical protein DC3_02340 [Deinococcus cellulosilyticus NBRC 106333 = KACC 11606]